MRFSTILDRWDAGEMAQETAELLGISVRSFERWKERGGRWRSRRSAGQPVAAAGAGGQARADAGALPGQVHRAGQGRRARTTQRKPTWLVDVSIGSACRAAGR